MDDGDLRVLSVLTTWLGVHAAHVNADRLVRCVSDHASSRVRAYWAAVARWLGKDRRFARLAKLHDGPPIDLLPVGTEFQIARRGEDERFTGSVLRVPAGSLRDRDADVLSPESMVRLPGGLPGVAMAGFLGFVLARSVVETRGVLGAWFVHFLQDIVIFTLLFAVALAERASS
jgi:hypothetical protein